MATTKAKAPTLDAGVWPDAMALDDAPSKAAVTRTIKALDDATAHGTVQGNRDDASKAVKVDAAKAFAAWQGADADAANKAAAAATYVYGDATAKAARALGATALYLVTASWADAGQAVYANHCKYASGDAGRARNLATRVSTLGAHAVSDAPRVGGHKWHTAHFTNYSDDAAAKVATAIANYLDALQG